MALQDAQLSPFTLPVQAQASIDNSFQENGRKLKKKESSIRRLLTSPSKIVNTWKRDSIRSISPERAYRNVIKAFDNVTKISSLPIQVKTYAKNCHDYASGNF
ncbi:hypothetical protein DM01DRAFT_1340083 [Hesseltinella vesiculosa]|uniref:Uncharacterized protein n=1 Tax=Hesseltinella vesiculosa TaxID=101127 RepID=A0A1X2G508_9FUNG|nr:hypothetical protein DM01DRAFT_1340083 [Hesseltinella vesiculosa]